MRALFRNQPWLVFLLIGLVAQQMNMLTYKVSNEYAVPFAFLSYSFLFQAFFNLIFMLHYKKRHFPVVFQPDMIRNILIVTVIYMLNECLFIWIYRIGAPYAVATAVFSVMSLVIISMVGVAFLKEKMNRLQLTGIVLAVLAIIMIKVG